MKLEEIGFYTLSDNRAKNTSLTSPLKRCELILTDKCNFNCPYCQGLRSDVKGTLDYEYAKSIIDIWSKDNLENIRFSGGEPTTYKELPELIDYTKKKGVNRIAISTNGYQDFSYYKELIDLGVNDFSISLDACCSSFGDKMAGGIEGAWEKVINNIRKISELTYVTVGMVFTKETAKTLIDSVEFADGLGVSDIRIVSSAQWNRPLYEVKDIPKEILNTNPILNYRVNNYLKDRNIRGLRKKDTNKCPLVVDDIAVAGDYHFPCIIYLREGGNPIGKVNNNMRKERYKWHLNHNTKQDKICSNNCLDVCIDYNNKVMNKGGV